MAKLRQYDLILKDPLGNVIKRIDDYYSLKCALNVNRVGALIIELPNKYCSSTITGYSTADFGVDYQLEFYLGTGFNRTLVGDAPFFVTRIESDSDDDGRQILIVEAESAIALLERRINSYRSERNASDLNPRPSDDQMKYIVRNNTQPVSAFGSTAVESTISTPAIDTLRSAMAANFTVQADVGAITNTYQSDIENGNILDVLATISDYSFAEGEPLFFDVVRTTGNNLEFRTYVNQRGIDRTQATGGANAFPITPQNDTISAYKLAFDYNDAANRIYSGGSTGGVGRVYRDAQEPTLAATLVSNPWYLREGFIAANSDDPTDVQVEADAEYQRRKAIAQLTGRLGETAISGFGTDFNHGDRLTAFVEGVQLDVHLLTTTITLAEGREDIVCEFSTDLNKTKVGAAAILKQLHEYQIRFRGLEAREF